MSRGILKLTTFCITLGITAGSGGVADARSEHWSDGIYFSPDQRVTRMNNHRPRLNSDDLLSERSQSERNVRANFRANGGSLNMHRISDLSKKGRVKRSATVHHNKQTPRYKPTQGQVDSRRANRGWARELDLSPMLNRSSAYSASAPFLPKNDGYGGYQHNGVVLPYGQAAERREDVYYQAQASLREGDKVQLDGVYRPPGSLDDSQAPYGPTPFFSRRGNGNNRSRQVNGTTHFKNGEANPRPAAYSQMQVDDRDIDNRWTGSYYKPPTVTPSFSSPRRTNPWAKLNNGNQQRPSTLESLGYPSEDYDPSQEFRNGRREQPRKALPRRSAGLSYQSDTYVSGPSGDGYPYGYYGSGLYQPKIERDPYAPPEYGYGILPRAGEVPYLW